MLIKDALKPTGKAWREMDYYAQRDACGILKWVSKAGDYISTVALESIMADDWQPFPEEKEIRPEYTGELWKIKNSVWVAFRRESSCLKFMHTITGGEVDFCDWYLKNEVIHGKNGWERVFPNVEEFWGRSAIQNDRYKAAQVYANEVARQALEFLDEMKENISPPLSPKD